MANRGPNTNSSQVRRLISRPPSLSVANLLRSSSLQPRLPGGATSRTSSSVSLRIILLHAGYSPSMRPPSYAKLNHFFFFPTGEVIEGMELVHRIQGYASDHILRRPSADIVVTKCGVIT